MFGVRRRAGCAGWVCRTSPSNAIRGKPPRGVRARMRRSPSISLSSSAQASHRRRHRECEAICSSVRLQKPPPPYREAGDPAHVRPLRQRRDPRPARRIRRRCRPWARDHGGGACRRCRLSGRRRRRAPLSGADADVRLEGLRKLYGDVVAVDSVDLEVAPRRVLHDARPVRLREDNDASPDRRLRATRRGLGAARRPRRDRRPAVRAEREHRLPGLRALPAHDGRGERRVRPEDPPRAESRAAGARRGGAAHRPADRLRRAQARTALGRTAPASRARACARQPSAGAAARRAARRARPEAPPGDADRAEAHPARGRDHVHLRHARPGRGPDDERPHRRLQRGPDRAGRPAGPGLRASATEFVAGFVGVSNLLTRDGHRSASGPRRSGSSTTARNPNRERTSSRGRSARSSTRGWPPATSWSWTAEAES